MKFDTIVHLSWPVLIVILLASAGTTSAVPVSTTLDQPQIPEKVDDSVAPIRVPKRDLPHPAAAPDSESKDDVSLSKRRMMVYGQIRYVNPAHYRKRETPSTFEHEPEPEPESESEEKIDPKRQIVTENPYGSAIRVVTHNPPATVLPEGEEFEPEAEEGDVESLEH
ncbi:hypothetical protein BGZ47_000588 [Haplosporangium gracile]|nr:hypothetical protein BGZ47_000588 [Haplosporangium gracile]